MNDNNLILATEDEVSREYIIYIAMAFYRIVVCSNLYHQGCGLCFYSRDLMMGPLFHDDYFTFTIKLEKT